MKSSPTVNADNRWPLKPAIVGSTALELSRKYYPEAGLDVGPLDLLVPSLGRGRSSRSTRMLRRQRLARAVGRRLP